MQPEQLLQRVLPVQLATLVRQLPKGASNYVFELKFDGYRILAVKAGRGVRLFSRAGQDWTAEFEPIAAAIRGLAGDELVVDGEACALDARGVPRFQLLQNRLGHPPRLAYFVFDLLWEGGDDLRPLPLEQRRDRLTRLTRRLPDGGLITPSSALSGDPEALLRAACGSGLEGIIAKEKGSPYAGGRRPTWLKIKCTLGQEFAIVGYLPLLGTRRGEVGSLLVALKEGDGRFHYAGKVGTGFTNAERRRLGKLLETDHVDAPPVVGAPRLGGIARWARPRYVAQVEFTEWTEGGHARHPSFHGLRDDKTPDECVRELAPRTAGRPPPSP